MTMLAVPTSLCDIRVTFDLPSPESATVKLQVSRGWTHDDSGVGRTVVPAPMKLQAMVRTAPNHMAGVTPVANARRSTRRASLCGKMCLGFTVACNSAASIVPSQTLNKAYEQDSPDWKFTRLPEFKFGVQIRLFKNGRTC